jgi:aminopeptidase N
MAHEWWANLVTVADWKDFWIHEGFATYAQALYVERLHGRLELAQEMRSQRRGILNHGPLAPRVSRTTDQMYFTAGAVDAPGGDLYGKGACVLHTLRWLIGDPAFFKSLRRMAYPDPAQEGDASGRACRLASTEEFQAIVEREAGADLDWFFEVYLRRAQLPRLATRVEKGELLLSWEAPDGIAFPMPVPLQIGKRAERIECPGGSGRIARAKDALVDPEGWLLRE